MAKKKQDDAFPPDLIDRLSNGAREELRQVGISERGVQVWSRDIVSQTAIARRLGITSQAVWNWTSKSIGFPDPLPGTDADRPLWDWNDVQNWYKNWVPSKGGSPTHRANRVSQ